MTSRMRVSRFVFAPILCFLACGTEAEQSDPTPSPVPSATVPRPVDAGTPSTDAGTTPVEAGPPPEKALHFLALGDTGKGNEGQAAVGKAMADKCKKDPCDFVVLLGDNIYNSGPASADDPQFQTKFEIPYADVNLDFQIVLGNHDYGGEGLGIEFGKSAHEVAYTKISKKWKLPAPHYRFSKGSRDFFVLDTNLVMHDKADTQKADVDAWLASSTATWKIAMGHHPYLSNGKHGNAGSYDGLPFVPIVNGKRIKDYLEDHVCGKVDLYLAGHDHSQQWLNANCKGTALAVSGAGAEGTTLSSTNPTAFQSLTLGFMYITIKDRELTAEFIDEQGISQHTETLRK